MNSFKKKAVALILLLATLAVAVPFYDFTEVSASSYIKDYKKVSGSQFTSSDKLAAKLNQVFAGKIGLYTSSSYSKSVTAPIGCSKMNKKSLYYIKGNSTGAGNNGRQCYIYANAVYNTLYNEWVGRGTSLKNSKIVIKGGSTFSYKQFVKAGVKCGAYVRTTGNKNGSYSGSVAHSFVILGYNEETVTYIEGNADGKGLVRVTKCTWSELNKAQTTGRKRYICHVVQPTDAYYNSLYGTKTASSGSSSGTVVDPDTVKVSYSRVLVYNSKSVQSGKDVKYMQTCLKYLGYSVTVNSKYDKATAAAVKKYQTAKKLTANGKLGKQTWASVESAVKTKKASTTVTVKYDANGGSEAPAAQSIAKNKSTALTKAYPVRSGYTFMGWAKSMNAKDVDYKAGASVKLSANTTLYAVWSSSAIKFTNQPASVTVASGASVSFEVAAEGSGLKYQWVYKKNGDSKWSNWVGHTTASTTGNASSAWNGMQLRCVVTDANGHTAVSETVKVTIG